MVAKRLSATESLHGVSSFSLNKSGLWALSRARKSGTGSALEALAARRRPGRVHTRKAGTGLARVQAQSL
jgi:hypothetical protein